jgi:hypothetical protein
MKNEDHFKETLISLLKSSTTRVGESNRDEVFKKVNLPSLKSDNSVKNGRSPFNFYQIERN